MKQLFTAHMSLWSRRGSRIALVTALLAIALAFSAFTFAPAAYAASATSQAPSSRPNVCFPNQPCVTIWATHVNVRNGPPMSCFHHPAINCQIQGTIAGGGERIGASCQQPGQTVQ